MSDRVWVVGVGMNRFQSPRNSETYDVMGARAVRTALDDAALDLTAMDQAFASYVYGDSTCGQKALYRVGKTGIPIVNVNNNCSSGSSALWLARQAVLSGTADCVLAFGFEQMQAGPLVSHWADRPDVFEAFNDALGPDFASLDAPMAVKWFGAAGAEYASRYDLGRETFAMIAVKARRHAAANPHALLRDAVSVEQVLASPALAGPLTRLQCCPPSCGAAAVILASDDFVERHGLARRVAITAQAMATDEPDSFAGDMMRLVGYGLTERAASLVYESAGVDPGDIDVVELHDCFTSNEVLSYEALGLTAPGTAERFIRDGDNTYGGRVVTNPSGGLLAKGHPLGATGLAQCAELAWQLRGSAEGRQVDGARVGLQHNIGLGGAAVVTLYERFSSSMR